MTRFRPRLWTSVGAAVLLSAGGLACSGEGGETSEKAEAPVASAAVGEGGEGGAEGGAAASGEAGAQAAYAGVPEESRRALRLAHLKGFFLVAQAVQRVQGAEAAASLAGQGMLEVFDPAAGNFRAAGVDDAVLRKAAQAGDEASLRAAVAALEAAQKRAGGDGAAVATAMANIAAGLYREATEGGAVDPVEYQHAYGAALAAQSLAQTYPKLASAKGDLDRLVRLFPSAVAPEDAAKAPPLGQVQAQASRVELALSGA